MKADFKKNYNERAAQGFNTKAGINEDGHRNIEVGHGSCSVSLPLGRTTYEHINRMLKRNRNWVGFELSCLHKVYKFILSDSNRGPLACKRPSVRI